MNFFIEDNLGRIHSRSNISRSMDGWHVSLAGTGFRFRGERPFCLPVSWSQSMMFQVDKHLPVLSVFDSAKVPVLRMISVPPVPGYRGAGFFGCHQM